MTAPFFGSPLQATAKPRARSQTQPFFGGDTSPLTGSSVAGDSVTGQTPFFAPQPKTPQGAQQAAFASNPFFGAVTAAETMTPTNVDPGDPPATGGGRRIGPSFPTGGGTFTTDYNQNDARNQWRQYQLALTAWNHQVDPSGNPGNSNYGLGDANAPTTASSTMPVAPTGIRPEDQVAALVSGQEGNYTTTADGTTVPTEAAQAAQSAALTASRKAGLGVDPLQASADVGNQARAMFDAAAKDTAARGALPSSWEQYSYNTDANGGESGRYRGSATDPFTQFQGPASTAPLDSGPGSHGGDRTFDYGHPGTYDSIGIRVDNRGRTFDTKTGKQLSGAETDARARAGGFTIGSGSARQYGPPRQS